jgi:hypothetical protein
VPDVDSDEYNNLIVLESKIGQLKDNNLLSEYDVYLIKLLADGRTLKELEDELGKTRLTISRDFIKLCNRIAYSLGGYFTEDGFIDNMKENYKLTEDEIERVKEFMRGRFKHKLIRKRKNGTH